MTQFIKRFFTSLALIFLFTGIFFFLPYIYFSLLLALILGYILFFEWPQLCKPKRIWLVTPLYPVAPFVILIFFNHFYHILLFKLFLTVACFDSASYLCGKLFGKHKILPSVSPGKTWEGALGGYLVTCLLFKLFFCSSWQQATIFTLTLCFFAFWGDMFESWLKRRVGIKDTASILPGHGGFLDRLDGVMFAAIGIYFLRNSIF